MAWDKHERSIIYLISAVQFINVLEFLMVIPLGPDFAKALAIPTSHLGYIGGSYTAAASVSGLLASLFLERFDRRKALAAAMAGLIVATLAGGMAVDLTTLMAARVLAGTFGGPAAALSLAIIVDSIPPERRGKAMGTVMGSFSIASVLGVPAGLELARLGGWRLPFFAVAALAVVVAGGALLKLPPMRRHLEQVRRPAAESLPQMVGRPLVLLALLQTAVLTMSTYLIIPNLAPFVQLNLGYPRERLGLLYLCGGTISFFTMRLVGRLTDTYGAAKIGTLGSLLIVSAIYAIFIAPEAQGTVMLLFTLFMVSNSSRMIPCQTQNSKIPRPYERARFMSVQSSVQHMSGAVGAFLSAHLLTEGEGGVLVGIGGVALAAMGLSLAVPVLLWTIRSRLAAETVPAS